MSLRCSPPNFATAPSKAALAREFGVTRPTVYRALKNA
ncbi:hypothetical protein [Corynebacterium tuberculostearicum]|nr:hypothetical protein [Corynebacterium tuberculostearicum]